MKPATSQADMKHYPHQMLRQLPPCRTFPYTLSIAPVCSPANSTLECSFSAVFSVRIVEVTMMSCLRGRWAVAHTDPVTEPAACLPQKNLLSTSLRLGHHGNNGVAVALRWRRPVDSLVEMARVSLDWTSSVKSTTRYLCTCICQHLVSSPNMCCLMTA